MKIEEKIKSKFLYSNNLNLFKILYFTFQYLKSKFKPRIINSNWGIDLIVSNILRNKRKGIYIDVGCHHPLINNNTYTLHKKGWSGLNIDLDHSSIEMFKYFRPLDDNKKIALSNKTGFSKLYFFHNRAAKNTIYKARGEGAKSIKKIKTSTLDKVIKDSKLNIKKVDFLSIDVEGNELNVLKGFNFTKYKPNVVVLEFINPKVKEFYQHNILSITSSKIYKYMIRKKYKLVNWVHDDLIFVKKSFIIKK